MFPVHAKCVTFDAGWPKEQVRAREELELGKVYTVRHMVVGQSDSHLSFYEIPGTWSTVFFDAYFYELPGDDDEDDEDLPADEGNPRWTGWPDPWCCPPGGNDEETQ